jgi:hypothetical protein
MDRGRTRLILTNAAICAPVNLTTYVESASRHVIYVPRDTGHGPGCTDCGYSRHMTSTSLRVHFSFHKSLNSVQTANDSLNIHFNVILVSKCLYFNEVGFFLYILGISISVLLQVTHTCYISGSFIPPPFIHTNDIWWTVTNHEAPPYAPLSIPLSLPVSQLPNCPTFLNPDTLSLCSYRNVTHRPAHCLVALSPDPASVFF